MLAAVTIAVAITLAFSPPSAMGQDDCPCFPYGKNITNIICIDTSLTSIPKCVPSNSPMLSILTPTIPLVPETFKRFTNLTRLSIAFLDDPKISYKIFLYQNTLKHFKILWTDLDHIDNRWFTYAPGLISVDFFSNKISSVDVNTFSSLPNLTTVNLNYNLLTTLPPTLFEGTSLRRLYLDENPWHCECEMMKFMQWIYDHNVTMSKNATCWQPLDMRGVNLLELTEETACAHLSLTEASYTTVS